LVEEIVGFLLQLNYSLSSNGINIMELTLTDHSLYMLTLCALINDRLLVWNRAPLLAPL